MIEKNGPLQGNGRSRGSFVEAHEENTSRDARPRENCFWKLFTHPFEELQIESEIGSDFRASRASIFLLRQTL